MGAAMSMAAAAAIAFYIAKPPPVTLEEAIVGNAPGVELTTYNPSDNVFGQDDFGPDAASPDLDQQNPTDGIANGFAG